MEDYDVFNEMQELNSKKSIIIIEDDEDFILNNLLKSNYEIIPIRFSYDLSCFSKKYINKTKELYTYYYDEKNTYKNEFMRLKKHFTHYQRKPKIAYVPSKYKNIIEADLARTCPTEEYFVLLFYFC